MKKTIILILLSLIILSSVFAVFNPYDDIDMKFRYNLINGVNAVFNGTVNITILYINGSLIFIGYTKSEIDAQQLEQNNTQSNDNTTQANQISTEVSLQAANNVTQANEISTEVALQSANNITQAAQISSLDSAILDFVNESGGIFTGLVQLKSNLNVSGNITFLQKLFLDDEGHSFQLGGRYFDSIASEAFTFSHPETHVEGTIAFLLETVDNKTLIVQQVGRNNSAGIWGNSLIIGRNTVVRNNFQSNLTKGTNCLEWYDFFNQTVRTNCDSSDGADMIITGELDVWNNLFVGEGLLSEGTANFIMSGNEFNIINGSIHVATPVTFEIGFIEGDTINNLQASFPGTLSPFINNQSDSGNWQATSNVLCDNDLCAMSDGSGSGNIVMKTNFNTVNTNETVLYFVYSLVSLLGGNIFTVDINNGSGWVNLFTDSGTETLISQNIDLTSNYWNQSSIDLRFICDASSGARECFVDSILVNGTAMATTLANQSGFDSNYCTSDGSLDVNNHCNSGLIYDAATDTHFTRGTWNITGTVAGGVTGTGTANAISKWSSLSAQTNSIMTDNGSIVIVAGGFGVRDAPSICPAGTAMTFTNMTSATCTTFVVQSQLNNLNTSTSNDNSTQAALYFDSSEAATFITVNTGQGSNELYDMNQNVLTTSNVTFNNVTADSINLTSLGWIVRVPNGGGLWANTTHTCIVGPDGDVTKAICDVD